MARALEEAKAQIAMRRLMTTGRRRTRKVAPQQQLPRGPRLDYHRQLMKIQDIIDEAVEMHVLNRLEEFEKKAAIDRPEDAIRQDAIADDLVKATEQVRGAVANALSENSLVVLTQNQAGNVNRFNRKQVGKQLESVVGVDIITNEPWVSGQVQSFVRDNTRLIKNLATDQVDKIENVLLRGARRGKRHEVLREEVQKRLKVGRKRAALIARDQTSKLNGEINQLRQTTLGVTKFTWRTVGDERVRPVHEDLDGQVFEWANPPSEGIPGEPVNCRCTAEPVLDELLG